MERTVENAHAKINLGLEVLRRRGDGYHDLLSVFQTLDLHDRLIFEPVGGGKTEILCDDPEVPAGRENLVFRAVEALREATGAALGVRVVLDKQIPAGAGLGGGSSDAAATLRALNRVWSLNLSGERLRALAGKLGSDVPFFLKRGTAVVTGRGERIRYISFEADVSYVLVYPGFKISSGWAYQNSEFALTERSKYINFLDSIGEGKGICPAGLLGCLENAFLPLVKATYPEVEDILKGLASCGAVACSLSGSGSTLYGVFWEGGPALAAAERLAARGYRVAICRPEVG